MRITASASVAKITFSADDIVFHLEDGRKVSAPFAWFPRLQTASSDQRKRWYASKGRTGVHWDDIDEDINVTQLLTGRCD